MGSERELMLVFLRDLERNLDLLLGELLGLVGVLCGGAFRRVRCRSARARSAHVRADVLEGLGGKL